MEVDGAHFKRELLSILRHIADAAFVTLDLEMSGITTRPRYQAGDRSLDAQKPSLQDQYNETRDAAETFQVLQLGITCVEEDREKEFYLARPYNFNLSPLLEDKGGLDIERRFTFSSNAVSFLTNEGFDFGKVFSSGVPYLSEAEEIKAREGYKDKIERSGRIPDLSLDDAGADLFYSNARQIVMTWISAAEPKLDYVNITNDNGPLSGYQRRLIYQLIRNEFPGYRTFPCNGGSFMQVVKTDPLKETAEARKKQERFNNKITDQKGLRFIFDALSGGSLDNITPAWFLDDHSPTYSIDKVHVEAELDSIRTSLQNYPSIIVGHNVFTDLAFLYKTFVGKLPTQVTQFQRSIHQLFPTVLDTKFLATQGAGTLASKSSLSECLEPLRLLYKPLIVLHEKFNKYASAFGRSHEAGYDSWMTAELFVKLTAQIYHQFRPRSPSLWSMSDSLCSDDDDSDSGGVRLSPFARPINRSIAWHRGEEDPAYTKQQTSEYSPGQTSQTTSSPKRHVRKVSSLSALALDASSLESTNHDLDNGECQQEPGFKQWIPDFNKGNEQFWGLYRNRLRVAGTMTGVCDLEE